MQAIRTIHTAQSHFGWDNSIPPVSTVAPGTTLELETIDASAGQLTENSRPEDLGSLDSSRVNPVTGPIAIEGAESGDALKVSLLGFEPATDWGWTAVLPGFGLLSEDFPDPALHIWRFRSLDELSSLVPMPRFP